MCKITLITVLDNPENPYSFLINGEKNNFFFYLKKKSIPNIANIDPAKYKLGYKAGAIEGNKVIVFERVNKKETGKYWEQVGSFKPTKLIHSKESRIHYFVKKWIHKDIISQKNCVEYLYKDGTTEIFRNNQKVA